MLNIPVNFLDKLKFEIAKVNNPQYFFQFWKLTGNIDDHVLESAFNAVYDTIPKLNTMLVFQDEEYQYQQQAYQLNFMTMNTSVSLIEYLQGVLEQDLQAIVKNSKEAPIILLKIQNTVQNRFVICLMVNHMFCDATSAYLFFECLTNRYNAQSGLKNTPFEPIEPPVDDAAFMQRDFTHKEQEQFNEALSQHSKKSAHFFSADNVVKKIYTENNTNAVFFDYFHLPLISLNKPDNINVNSIISAMIAKAYLTLKGHLTGQTVSMSISANARAKGSRIFGNYVSAISVQLQNDHLEILAEKFQRQITDFNHNPQRIMASYSSLVSTFKDIKAGSIMDGCRAFSSKYHFYISNYGAYNPENKNASYFPRCQLQIAGGFNFPLQAHYGLIFVLVPFNNSIGISIACSPMVFSKKEIYQFKMLITQMVETSNLFQSKSN